MAPLKQRKRKPPGPDRAARRAPTLADVARIAGVSKMTASRALSGQHLVVPETAAEVRAAADLLPYVPNGVVRMLLERLDPAQPQRRPAAGIVDVGFRVIARESA